MKILVINGVNMNMLGIREPEKYGSMTLKDLEKILYAFSFELGVDVEMFQSNHEGEIVEKIHSAYQNVEGIVINPGAYTHTSVAILDALKAVMIPAVEVHISDVDSREEFRRFSYTSLACEKTYKGMGFKGYTEAVKYLFEKYGEK